MKEIDFLPRHYIWTVQRRQQNRRNMIISTGLILVMVCLHLLNVTRMRSAEASLAVLQNGAGSWQSAHDQLAELQRRKVLYRQRCDLISRLDDAAPLDAAIGEISQLLSESMSLRSLEVDAREPVSREVGKVSEAHPPGGATRVVLVGTAGSDVDVGIFLGKLSSCPLFAQVSLSYSREARDAGRLMREFEMKFRIRPVEATP